MPVVLRRFAEMTPVPWRNGGGTTVELIDERGSADLTPGLPWRLSIAHLATPGPFSVFPDRVRTLVPWGGDITLSIDDEVRLVRAGEVVRFSGAARTQLVAVDDACHAVNLVAFGSLPTLDVVGRGSRRGDAVAAVAGEHTEGVAPFDVLTLATDERMPGVGILVVPTAR